jgi:hypothetical protein
MTTRKPPASLVLAAAVLALAGCATPGPLHVYTLPAGGGEARVVTDTGEAGRATVPGFLQPAETVAGFAYDPFTDHFFLRLAPGDRIRVVDRPARAIKREFEIAGADDGGDLAVRPRDGHLFLLQTGLGQVIETSRLGKAIRTFVLAGAAGATGLAFDPSRDRLLVLSDDGRRVSTHDLDGRRLGEVSLAQPAGPSLAFDAGRREFYAPRRDRPEEIGVFGEDGTLLRTAASGAWVDVGVRSFVRVF